MEQWKKTEEGFALWKSDDPDEKTAFGFSRLMIRLNQADTLVKKYNNDIN